MRSRYTLWMSPRKDSGTAWFLGVLALIVIVVCLLNLAVPESSALHVSSYGLTLTGKYLCYAMLAMAVVSCERRMCFHCIAKRLSQEPESARPIV